MRRCLLPHWRNRLNLFELDYMEYSSNALTQASWVSTDLVDSYTTLLVHCDGLDGSTTFTDASASGLVVTAGGSAQVDTANKKYGSGSCLLDGSTAYLNVADSDAINFGTGSFTVDFWFYTVDQTVLFPALVSTQGGWNAGAWGIRYENTGLPKKVSVHVNVLGDPILTSALTYEFGQWLHVALVRNVNQLTLWVNGALGATVAIAAGTVFDAAYGGSCRLGWGTWDGGNGYYNGAIDEIRFSKGVARWILPFVPPTEPSLNSLVDTSENTIKTQGYFSMKAVATTDSLNQTLTKTFTGLDLRNLKYIKFDLRASRVGSNLKFGIYDSSGTTTEITPIVNSANTWQTILWDISAIADGSKAHITKFIITVVNADAENTFYIDNIYGMVA